jgi:hypothetical protein
MVRLGEELGTKLLQLRYNFLVWEFQANQPPFSRRRPWKSLHSTLIALYSGLKRFRELGCTGALT